MICPNCGEKDMFRCKESRPSDLYRRRRYECICGERFTTYEVQPHDFTKVRDELLKRGVRAR